MVNQKFAHFGTRIVLSYAVLLGIFCCVQSAVAAPYGIARQSWREQFFPAEVVVILKLSTEKASPEKVVLRPDINRGKTSLFRVVEVLKGNEHIEVGDLVELIAIPYSKPKQPPHAWLARYQIGFDGKSWWNDAMPISEVGQEYARKVVAGMPIMRRAGEYYHYWNSGDARVSDDAMHELKRLKIEEFLPVREQIDHDLMVRRATDRSLDPDHRELALELLAVSGKPADKEWLRKLSKTARETDVDTDLDFFAMYAYLALAKEEGVRWLESDILADPQSLLHGTALNALASHARTANFLSPERVVKALHVALVAPEPVPSVILELTDLKDWSQLDRIGKLGVTAAKAGDKLRYNAVLRYLFACPLPEAEGYCKQMKELVPKAYDRLMP